MNKNLPLVFVFLLVMLSSEILLTQEHEEKTFKNAITFNVFELVKLEARLGYERLLAEKHALRASVGIQFPVSSGPLEENGATIISISINKIERVSKGIYLALGYNYLIIPDAYFYVSPEVYYNYSFYNDIYYEYCTGMQHDSYVTLQSMRSNKSGIKFLVGKKVSFSTKKKTRLQFDFFAGIGIQHRQEEITVFKKKYSTCNSNGGNYYEYDPPQITNTDNWGPAMDIGISLCYLF
ncbi:MAG: hypothetical protein K8R63_10170 [Bacteroidales bacterium]|nr:hypothetical protein [Bacteroidales bacterium]